jgi:hypothetical protein
MIGKTAQQIWDAALAMSPGNLIDKFLDWVDELGGMMLPARVEEFVLVEQRRDPFSA